MNRTNWSGNNAPVQGDDLRFQNGLQTRLTNTNDFPADTTFGALRFDAPLNATLNYTLTGNPLRLNDGVRLEPTSGINLAINGTITISNHLGLNQAQTFTNALDGDLHFAGGVALDGNTLSVGVRANADLFFDAPVTGHGRFDANAGGRVSLTSSNEITGALDISQGLVLGAAPPGAGLGGRWSSAYRH